MSEHPQWQPTNPPIPPVRQKGWFARNPVLSIVLGIVLLVVLCCCGAGALALGGATDEPTTQESADPGAGDSSTAEDATPEPGGTSKGAKENEKRTPTKKPTATEKKQPAAKSAPGVGSPVRDGKFEFTVTKVETGVSEVGSEYLTETADGQFVLVHITVKNIGDEAQTLFDSEQKLIDAQGRSFATDSTASIFMEDNDVWINEINPGNTVEGTLVYDMPAGAQPTQIELHDSMFSGGVTVSVK
ncbi:DUF4352 domain-containing protein [Janibacter sp. GS2]|uniref:DUF4352 domain-containing protein n=1 Tax=Janibacter sp. GS2 TaxID=3442646 RepID=UPI003EB8588E